MTARSSSLARSALDAEPAATAAPIVILGAGIGGLATALALARRGIASTVLEKRSVFEPEGAGIQIGPNGTRILEELGIAGRLEPLAGKPDEIHARSAITGQTLSRLPLGEWIATRHGAPYWVLHRSDLHHALHEAAVAEPLITINMGFAAHAVSNASARNDDDTLIVEAAGGKTFASRALVVADGLRSSLRDQVFDVPPLTFARKSAARAVITAEEMPAELRENATAIWMSPSAHTVHYPVRAGREVALIFVRADAIASDDWSASVSAEWITDCAREFAEPLRQLLATPRNWKKWALYELPPMKRLSNANICLLGDAAHPTLPFMAQGGVLALEDAATLASCVEQSPADLARAFAIYDRERLARTSSVVAQARRNGQIYHLDGFAARARDATLRLTPPEILMARYDWIYGWKARVTAD